MLGTGAGFTWRTPNSSLLPTPPNHSCIEFAIMPWTSHLGCLGRRMLSRAGVWLDCAVVRVWVAVKTRMEQGSPDHLVAHSILKSGYSACCATLWLISLEASKWAVKLSSHCFCYWLIDWACDLFFFTSLWPTSISKQKKSLSLWNFSSRAGIGLLHPLEPCMRLVPRITRLYEATPLL